MAVYLTDNDLVYLYEELCPYCGNDLDVDQRFSQEDDREGGVMFCPECRIKITWIDNPLEYEIREDPPVDAPAENPE